MNIITYFNQILEESFKSYLKKYFNTLDYIDKISKFSNYYNFINDLDDFSDNFMKQVIIGYFEYIDNCFFNSFNRKKYCDSNGFLIHLYALKYAMNLVLIVILKLAKLFQIKLEKENIKLHDIFSQNASF